MTETLVVGAGCFWCVEAIFRELRGVSQVLSGYAGGGEAAPSYEQVCTGQTGYAEAIQIEFDPELISRRDLLRIFFTVHDPTQLNRQGGDVGPQYRSVIFVSNDAEKELAGEVLAEVTAQGLYPDPIVTTQEPLDKFHVAEDYHQQYFRRYETGSMFDRLKMNHGYCQAVVAPKVSKFRKQYLDLLKSR